MTAAATCARLRATEPARWQAVALAWRQWAALVGGLLTDLAADLARLRAVWSGAAAAAAVEAVSGLRRRLVLFRVVCWQADQAAGEFATALERARRLFAGAQDAASRAGLSIEADGTVHGAAPPGAGVPRPSAADPIAAGFGAAISLAERADAAAATRMAEIETAAGLDGPGAGADLAAAANPGCLASPGAVARWWAGLNPATRRWLLATEPAALARLDGLPAADRDAANRLLLDEQRADLDHRITTARGRDRDRLRELRDGLGALAGRLADDAGPRAYLLRLDLREEGRTVVALGDPDRADSVVTHVPGMTADLASFRGELTRAARVAERAGELSPATSTSAILWLDYDAPDFVDEAAGARRAEEGAPALRRFLEGLRAGHEGTAARQTLVGHSYGSLLVGRAAAGAGLAADEVVFVGSPGVGADTVADLAVPKEHVWSSTSRSDVIQYAAASGRAAVRDLLIAGAMPAAGPVVAVTPERDLWFGRNPSDPSFGAHVFPSAARTGHLGYWDRGSPSLDALAAITLGTAS